MGCGGRSETAGWPGGSVLGKGIGCGFVCLYCIIGATLFPLVCICIDFTYDIFPCQKEKEEGTNSAGTFLNFWSPEP